MFWDVMASKNINHLSFCISHAKIAGGAAAEEGAAVH